MRKFVDEAMARHAFAMRSTWHSDVYTADLRQFLTAREAVLDRLAEALGLAINEADRNTCQHEETYRGGAIWTICHGCDMKWADDRGGFKAHEDSKNLATARAAFQAYQESKQ